MYLESLIMTTYDFLIAARNSEVRIGATLTSLYEAIKNSQIALEKTRILLIDNGSTDSTRNIAEDLSKIIPLEIIDAPEPGKSRALNVAVKTHLKGDVIFFTDDDVTFADNWLDEFIKAIDQNPDYDIFAGKIVGTWEQELPADLASWIPLGSTYAIHENIETGPCPPGKVWGPNMAVRRKVFENGILFNPLVGPQPGGLYPMGQDTEFAERAATAGHQCYFVADAIVEHTIKAKTANEDWILRRAERLGYGIFAVPGRYKKVLPKFVPLGLEVFLQYLAWSYAAHALSYLMPRGKKRFWVRWRGFYYKGLWQSYWRFASS